MYRTSLSLACALFFACSSTTTTSSPPPGVGGASAAQVDTCKHAGCDKMKFFGCNSAEEQAACYADCDAASASQIDLFASCAENSVCDPACRSSIVPKPAPGAGSGGGGTGGATSGGGASASSCGAACDKLVSCSFLRVGDKDACTAQCEKQAYQYQIDCVNGSACDKMKSACGDPTGGLQPGVGTGGGGTGADAGGGADDGFAVQVCQSACDTLSFFTCFDAASHQTCRDLCASAPANKRDAFTSCAHAAGGDCARGTDCYGQLKP